MALIVGVNSYSSLADAETYFTTRIDVAAWHAATESQKEAALVTASIQLNNLNWFGVIMSPDQDLAFPRKGYYLDQMAGKAIYLDGTVVPNRIINAVYEQAYHLLNNDGLLDGNGSPDSIKVGPIELIGLKSTVQSKISPLALAFYKPLLSRAHAGGMWHRAN